MSAPQEGEKRNDVLDLLIDGMQTIREEKQDDGTIKRTTEFNPESAWYKSHVINQPFGRMALMIERVTHLAKCAKDFMYISRADVIEKGMMYMVDENKRSIDAKSSETYKDKNNTQASLIHILSKNKIEKQYTVKGSTKKTLVDGIMGREAGSDDED